MADISKLKVGSTEYSIKDTTARSGVSTNATAITNLLKDVFLSSESDNDVSAQADTLAFSLYNGSLQESSFIFPAATTTKAGVLTASDKVKINKIDTITKDIAGGMHFIGTTSTALTDGATTATLVAASTGSLNKTTGFIAGDMVIYKGSEFVWTGSAWALFGDLSSLGSLAYKSSASGTLPSSSHSHSFTGSSHSHTATVSGGGVTGSCIPKGKVSIKDSYTSSGSFMKMYYNTTSSNVDPKYLVAQDQLSTTSLLGVSGVKSITPFGSAGSLPTGATVLTSATGNSTSISVSDETLTIPASVLTGISTSTGNALSSRGALPTAGTAVAVAIANSSPTTVATYIPHATDDSNWLNLTDCLSATFTGSSSPLSLTHTNPTVSISSTTAKGTVTPNVAYASDSTVTVK